MDTLSGASAQAAKTFLDRINDLLGIVRSDYGQAAAQPAESAVSEALVTQKLEERAQAKKNRDYTLADQIRKELDEMGIEVQDTPEGTIWKLKSLA